jgi:hypothetical protein
LREKTRRLALCGLLSALAEVCLLLGGIVPAAVYCCPILSMLALLPVREEFGPRTVLTAYAAVALLGLLLVPDKEPACVYLLMGWYPAAQPYLDRLSVRPLRIAVKLAVFCAAVAGPYALLLAFLWPDAAAVEFGGCSRGFLLLFLLLGCAVFLLTDLTLHRMAALWRNKLRRRWFRGV